MKFFPKYLAAVGDILLIAFFLLVILKESTTISTKNEKAIIPVVRLQGADGKCAEETIKSGMDDTAYAGVFKSIEDAYHFEKGKAIPPFLPEKYAEAKEKITEAEDIYNKIKESKIEINKDGVSKYESYEILTTDGKVKSIRKYVPAQQRPFKQNSLLGGIAFFGVFKYSIVEYGGVLAFGGVQEDRYLLKSANKLMCQITRTQTGYQTVLIREDIPIYAMEYTRKPRKFLVSPYEKDRDHPEFVLKEMAAISE